MFRLEEPIGKRLAKEARKVLRGQFSVITTAAVASELNRRAPRVDPPAEMNETLFRQIRDFWMRQDRECFWLWSGASGSGKTYAAIQAASKFANAKRTLDSGGCVLYYSVAHDDGHDSTVPQSVKWQEDRNASREALAAPDLNGLREMRKMEEECQKALANEDLNGLLTMLKMVDEQRISKPYYWYSDLAADIFAKYVERVCEKCTPLFAELKHTREYISVAVVLDDVGDKPYFVRAACCFSGVANILREKLCLSRSVELAMWLCGRRIDSICILGWATTPYYHCRLTPTSAERLWAALRKAYPELEEADRVSPTFRAMGRSNARMAMLLVECVTERKRARLQQPLDENVVATAEAVACQAAMRFKEMTEFWDVADRKKMLELYGQALRTCVWHTDPYMQPEHPELLSKYGAITDLRSFPIGDSDRLVAAKKGAAKGRCFTMAPAMAAFFRIMLSDDWMGATAESFEHAMLHFVGAALRSSAGRSVRDFLSLIATDATTIPSNDSGDDRTQTIPSDIDETLLVLSLGHRKFDDDSVGRALRLTTKMEDDDKEARATKEVLDLAFTATPATTTTTTRRVRKEHDPSPQEYRLTAKRPVVLLNGSGAAAADIVVIVPGVLVCHVLCDDSPDRFTAADGQPKMARSRYLTEPLQYCVVVTTAPPDTKLDGAIPKPKDMPLLLMQVPRSPGDCHGDRSGNCAFLQSLVGLCTAADGATDAEDFPMIC